MDDQPPTELPACVVLVAATLDDGRAWQRQRPDLGITLLVSPLAWREGMRPTAVYIAPDADHRDPDRFRRVMVVLRRRAQVAPFPFIQLTEAAWDQQPEPAPTEPRPTQSEGDRA